MLEGLDDIPWKDLEHAYGSAEDVPDLLRALKSSDPKVRSKTLSTLYANVFHQGSRYPASPYVIPFLIELCEDPNLFQRSDLLYYWASLITGYFNIRERPVWSDGEFVYGFGEPEKLDMSEPYSAALYEIYKNSLMGEELLYSLIEDEDVSNRATAAFVLACLPTIADRSAPKLRRQLQTEQSGGVRAAIAFALGELGDFATLRLLLDEKEHPAAQCMAACQLARIAPHADLISPLLKFIEDPIDGYANVPGAGGDSTGDAAISITYLPKEIQIEAIPKIFDRLDSARTFATMPFVNALLSAAFDVTDTEVTKLSGLQRQVLWKLVDCQELWTIVNLSYAFQSYGLPFDRKKCAQLAGVKFANDEALAELSTAVTFSDMGFLHKAREGIERALSIDPSVFARTPEPAECWLLCAKAFAETNPRRAIQAYNNAIAIDPNASSRVGVTWQLADLLQDSDYLE